MTQSIFGLGIGGTGIVALLIIAGIFLVLLDVDPETGIFAFKAGIIIAIILAILGIVGVLKRL